MLQDVYIVNPPCSSQSLGRFLFKHRSVELQYLIFEKSNKVENEKKS